LVAGTGFEPVTFRL